MDARSASFRYRVLHPARYLMSSGHDVSIGEPDFNADVMLFSKHYNKRDHEFAERFGGTRIFDICDYHLDKDHEISAKWFSHYDEMLPLADKIITSTDTLKGLLNGFQGIADVIQDTYEYPEASPRFKWPEDGILLLLWYGSPTNLPGLLDNAEELDGHKVWMITNKKVVSPELECSNWSPEMMMRGFQTCDAVVIPQRLTHPYYLSKGANRLMEAVRQGRFVLAHPVPSYKEFGKWMWIGNIREGIEWLKNNESEVEDRIKACQEYIKEKYSPDVMGKKWENLICR